jgi:hypothetical protein
MKPVLQFFRDKLLWCLTMAVVCGVMMGCGKAAAPADKTGANRTADVDAAQGGDSNSATVVAEAGPPVGEKICFACKGEGTTKCLAAGCVNGYVECPGPCLKLDRGTWVHMDVPGHPPTDLWQKFYLPDGSYTAYSQAHVGHVIAMQNGQAVDTGPCKICGGTGRVPCPACKGTGKQLCPICEGKKYIPVSWTPTDNPWLNGQPDLIRLASGRILFGKFMTTNGTDVLVKTRDGQFVHVQSLDIVPKGGGNGTM